MYVAESRWNGLGIAPVAAGSIFGPVGAAVGAVISAIIPLFGSAHSAVQAFQSNPTIEGAYQLQNQLQAAKRDWTVDPSRADAATRNTQRVIDNALATVGSYIQNYQAAPVAMPEPQAMPAAMPEPSVVEQIISQPQNYQRGDTTFREGEPSPASIPVSTHEPEVIPASTPTAPVINQPSGGSALPMLFSLPVGGAFASVTRRTASGTEYDPIYTATPIARERLDYWSLPSVPLRFLRPVGSMNPDTGECDCGTDWLGWLAAAGGVYYAYTRKRKHASRRS